MSSVRLGLWFGVLLCTLVSTPFATTTAGAVHQSSDRDYVRAAADAYLTNREAFTDFSCDYELTAGFADDPASAREGRLHDAMTGQGRWRVAGDKARIELICDRAIWDRAYKEAQSKNPGKFMVAVPLVSQVYLSDGQRQLVYNSFGGFGNLFPPEDQSRGLAITPWEMTIFGAKESKSPARRIQDALGRDLYCDVQRVPNGQATLARISLGDSARRLSCRMDLDPERGFLPVEFIQFSNDGKTIGAQLLVTDIRQAANGHWFPYHAVMISRPASQPPIPVTICKVTKLALGDPPEKEFDTQLNRGSQISNNVDPASGFWIKENERVGPSNLQALLDRSYRAAEVQHAKDAKSAKKRAASGARAVVGAQLPAPASVWPKRATIAALALVLAVVTYFAVKTMQSRRAA
jgi:hypothetical protein